MSWSDQAEFKSLVFKKRLVTTALTLSMSVGYFGFILLLAYNKACLAQKVGDHVTLGIPMGLGVIVLAWLVTGVYVWWANEVYDKEANKMKINWANDMYDQAAVAMKIRKGA